MRKFEYYAMDATGAEIVGNVFAKDEDQAQHGIRQKGYFITTIKELPVDNIPELDSRIKLSVTIPRWILGLTGYLICIIVGFVLGLLF